MDNQQVSILIDEASTTKWELGCENGLRYSLDPNKYGEIWGIIGDGLKKVHTWVKDNKIVSKVAGAFNPAAGAAAAQLGYGRKRRVVRRRRV